MTSIRQWLIREAATLSNQRIHDIGVDIPFSSLGIKSMELVAMTARLGKVLGRKLPCTAAFDYPTIESLERFLNNDTDQRPMETIHQRRHLPAAPDTKDAVAIVGIGCRFPGGGNDSTSFWQFILNGGDAISRVPEERWTMDGVLNGTPGSRDISPWGGFLQNIDQFDPGFFGISPREARNIDPQQRLVLEVGWEALEDAGIDPSCLRGANTGVFVGVSGSDYGRLLYKDSRRLDLYSGTGCSTAIVANRLSYTLGLRGPSISVDTACSSSLVTLDMACGTLKNKTCDLALAGGVNLILSPEMTIVFSKAGLMAKDGRCKTFDESADGYVRSEGCGMVVLKRYADAHRDGDRIYGILLGTHVNQDGESNGLTVPNGLAQEMLIRTSLEKAGVSPGEVSYAETHGTGTAIGDPIEVAALSRVMGKARPWPLTIGSVKTNIGHLEQAAGVAGLIKVLLAMAHETIPPHLHFNRLNPLISLDDIPARIPVEPVAWPRGEAKRIATVSGFSFGGVNAHVVVQEPPQEEAPQPVPQKRFHLLTLSAKTKTAREALIRAHQKYLTQSPGINVMDFCHTANTGRMDFPWRAAVGGESSGELVKGLDQLLQGSSNANVAQSEQATHLQQPVFMFTGQGSQYPGMGRELYRTQPVFRKALDRCHQILETQYEIPLLTHLFESDAARTLDQTAITQPALFSLEYALAQMYLSWGIRPAYVMGHSVGEYVAACIAEVFSLENGLRLIAARGRLIQNLPREGKMVVCLTSLAQVNAAMDDLSQEISVAAVNGPTNIVISGQTKAVDQLCSRMDAQKISWVPLHTSHAFHSQLMEPMMDEFMSIADQVDYAPPQYPYISNVSGQSAHSETVSTPQYWRDHIRASVLFQKGVEFLHRKGHSLFLELGPHPVLSGMGAGVLSDPRAVFATSLRRGAPDQRTVLQGLGSLYIQGGTMDWKAIFPPASARVISIPHYPFEKKPYWFDNSPESTAFDPWAGKPIQTPLDTDIWEYECPGESSYIQDHKVYGHGVMSGSTMATMVLDKLSEIWDTHRLRLDAFFALEPLYIPENQRAAIQLIFTRKPNRRMAFELYSRTDPTRDWTCHARGEGRPEPPHDAPTPTFSMESIQQRCSDPLGSIPFYEKIWDSGLQLGPHFKWIQDIYRRDGEALVRMRLPDDHESDAPNLPPGLIDSCIQTLFACISFDRENTYMFLGVDEIRFLATPKGRLFCHMKLDSLTEKNDLAIGHYHLWDEDGRLITQARGVHLKRAPKNVLRFSQNTPGTYLPEWSPDPTPSPQIKATGKWLIISPEAPLATAMSTALEKRGATLHSLVLDRGKPQNEIQAQITHEINQGVREILFIAHSSAGAAPDDISLGMQLIRLLPWLSQNHPSTRIKLVTSGGVPWDPPHSPIHPSAGFLWGLARVAARELPETFTGCFDIIPDHPAKGPGFQRWLDHIIQPGQGPFAALDKDHCRLLRLKADKKARVPVLNLSPNALYLITGGSGGLGRQLIQWLGGQGARHFALMARKPPHSKLQKEISRLEPRGYTFHIITGDVCDYPSVKAALTDKNLPPLKGVFHLAGIVRDGFLETLSPEDIKDTAGPKVTGAWNLHRLTRKQNLDYFVMFSSVVSLLGFHGQAPYGAANAYMDALAHARRQEGLPALSINWGPWAGEGMMEQLDESQAKRWDRQGFSPLVPGAALDAMARLMDSAHPQAAVLDIDWNRYAPHAGPCMDMIEPLATAPPSQGRPQHHEPIHPPMATRSPEKREKEAQQWVKAQVTRIMMIDPSHDLPRDTSLMEAGLDSLMAMELRNRFRKDWGLNLPLADFLKSPTLTTLTDLLISRAGGESDHEDLPRILPDPRSRHRPFELTDIQHAYWMGRNKELTLGGVSCHVYPEVEIQALDLPRLEKALDRLILRHDMLRAIIRPDGRQQIQDTFPPCKIPVQDLRKKRPPQVKAALEALRNRMSSQVLDSETGPLFEICASLLTDKITRLHISFDLLIGDGWSFNVLIRDLFQYYQDPEIELPALALTFRDYVNALANQGNTPGYQRAKAYWENRIPQLPPPPELPLALPPEKLTRQRFVRLAGRLEPGVWDRLKTRAARAGLTPSGVLLAAFCEILALWSKTKDFTINLTMFNRRQLHEQVNDIVGDFTTLNLLEVRTRTEDAFEKRAGRIQQQLWQDLEHRQVSGVEVLRQMGSHGQSTPNFPVVFTSVLPYGGKSEDQSTIGLPAQLPAEMVWCISQTPQVWLDHQIFERNGALTFNWDLVEDLFPQGMAQDMFDAYNRLIQDLALIPGTWSRNRFDLMPESQHRVRERVNHTPYPLPPKCLHELFFEQAARQPEKIALITSTQEMTYGELARRAQGIGNQLHQGGIHPNDLVAVVMDKSWEQAAAVLGILASGAAYIPLDPAMPRERLAMILKEAQVRIALTRSREKDQIPWPRGLEILEVDQLALPSTLQKTETRQAHTDLAYVVYTSGSTGKPKGVMIDHRGAVNTILDINRRFQVTDQDTGIALAELNFDLSVYDIFGLLGAGARLIIPDPSPIKDPSAWLEWMKQQKITIWNSVPQLMQMIMDTVSDTRQIISRDLRLVMLSGDWIPVDLPGKITTCFPHSRVFSLGGATEASIWSILHPIDAGISYDKSIPYGTPMDNQQFHVLNSQLMPCPDWVPGELFIGGTGLAKGYYNDKEKSQTRFIPHPDTGTVLYRTGDLGRYLPDGTIQFLGREDFQVKINGYRIECGEIETTLNRHKGVAKSLVHARKNTNTERVLIAYVVLRQPCTPETLKTFLEEKLPRYMVPATIEILENFPITANGKIDRNRLPRPAQHAGKQIMAETSMEEVVLKLFLELTSLETMGVETNFFDMGINSLQLVKIRTRIQTELKKQIKIVDLFKYATIRSLSRFLDKGAAPVSYLDQADAIAANRTSDRRKRLKSRRKKAVQI